MAPTGVFSSWLTLATKSRRIASTRRSRVRSSTSASTIREPERRHPGRDRPRRQVGPGHHELALADLAVAADLPDQVGELLRRRRPVPRTSPSAYAGADALSTTSSSSTRTAELRSTDSTAAAPGGTALSLTGTSCCCRSLIAQASTAPPATTAPTIAASAAWVVGSTLLIVRSRSSGVCFARADVARVHPSFTACPRLVTCRAYAPALMREAFHDQLDSLFDDLAAIAEQVRLAVHDASRALLTSDAEMAEAVISADHEIDRATEKVEDSAFLLLSLQQPVAGDLRTVVAALRMVSELERMGDLSVHVAKIARLRVPEIAVPAPARPTMLRMATVAEEMVSRVTRIIGERDVDAAEELELMDDEMDQLRVTTFSPAAGRRVAPRHRVGRRHRPARAATTSGSPTTPCRSPTGWSSSSPASTRSAPRTPRPGPTGVGAQRPWLATAAAAAAAASGSRYSPPATVGRRSASSR